MVRITGIRFVQGITKQKENVLMSKEKQVNFP